MDTIDVQANPQEIHSVKIHLLYGQEGLEVDIPSKKVTVLNPRHAAGLADEAGSFQAAVRQPLGVPPLRDSVRAGDKVAVVIPDGTRALPSDRLLPWLFAELAHVPAQNFTIIVGTGSHRPNTAAEIQRMVGRDIAARYRIINHDAYDPKTLEAVGVAPGGRPVRLNREYVRADRRILLGFIEPHFMAGFSGGYKAVFPGIADIDSILHYHRAELIADPRSTWGVLTDNPTQAHLRACGALAPVDFCINVALSREQRITRFFCGATAAAHAAGAAYVRGISMAPCRRPFPIVVTTNGGHPLDQNLYQAVKGIAAAAQIVEKGGLIVVAAKCDDGFPAHGNFRKFLFEHVSPQAMLDAILAPGSVTLDQWQVQKLAVILLRARVALYSGLSPAEVRRAHFEPITDLDAFMAAELRRHGAAVRVAVLPEGPLTIPYLSPWSGRVP